MKKIATKQGSKQYWLSCCIVAVLFCSTAFAANFPGAIYTTFASGTTVNGNIYPSKDAVYLNGGPQNTHSVALPDGTYYFQVTDPSGKDLLSSDAIACRQIDVLGGVVHGYHHDDACGTADHANGDTDPVTGAIPVQLIPYADTTNGGGEYKAWLTPHNAYDETNCWSNGGSHGFCDNSSKTDNFKVDTSCSTNCGPVLWPISGLKFYDTNGNGVQDAGEPGIEGWHITLSASPATVALHTSGFSSPTMVTHGDGSFNTDNDAGASNKPVAGGVYGVCETIPGGAKVGFSWMKSAACPNAFKATAPANFNYGGTFTVGTSGSPDVAFGSGPAYSLQYPVTATGGLVVNYPHLGIPYATCGAGYYNNIDDVFEAGGPHTYGGLSNFNDVPNTGTPLIQTSGFDSWNGAFPGAIFGNYCKNTPTGGWTLGFWSNNNGNAALITAGGGSAAGAVSYVNHLTDPNGIGLRFVGPTGLLGQAITTFFQTLTCASGKFAGTQTCFNYWLTSGSNGSNAANQLSVQMTTADLNINVLVGGNKQDPNTTVYAPGTKCADASGYASVGCLISEANYSLQAQPIGSPSTPSGSTLNCNTTAAPGSGSLPSSINCRTWQTAIQTALNRANNNVGVNPSNVDDAKRECGFDYSTVAGCTVTPIDFPPPPQP